MSLRHLDARGRPRMVDVSSKSGTRRVAVAESTVRLTPRAARALDAARAKKGDPLSVAVLAGVMGAKKTADLIPLCHPIPIESVEVEPRLSGCRATFRVTCVTTGRTGVEMEAMVGASMAALAFYDMTKSADRGLVIERVRLLKKSGGKSGTYIAGK
ncbi:cyclic pyranopterin monophosphate synthase MoaC [bacterium]|nr:cyclic pyranopterin monophosphate synthase MoaC [bacterium]